MLARALQRKDVLGLLPTGGGKSLTFQLATLLSPGTTIVVAPLKSLIDDQGDNLHRLGINRVVTIHSGHKRAKKDDALRKAAQGYPRFLYIAPERFHIKQFREELTSSPLAQSVAFVVVDEAHCVSEWGHDFRPAYLSVSQQARSLLGSHGDSIPIMALTATASNTVLVDIQRELGLDRNDADGLVSVDKFDRKELKFIPIVTGRNDKSEYLPIAMQRIAETLGPDLPDLTEEDLKSDNICAGIVFCRYVNGAFGVTGVENTLKSTFGIPQEKVSIYAGSAPTIFPDRDRWEDHKREVQRKFKENKIPLLVATNSFGMGIDKDNVRYTVHYGIPPSIEALAQEAGRAGRDTKTAACAVIFTDSNTGGETDYLNPQLDSVTVRQRAAVAIRKDPCDATRIMFLHGISFPGVAVEVGTLRRVFATVNRAWVEENEKIGETAAVTIDRPRSDSDAKEVEKAIYRLSVLGIIEDYTIDYPRNVFESLTRRRSPDEVAAALDSFVRRYDAGGRAAPILASANAEANPSQPYDHLLKAICDFSYEVIERSRREALENLVRILRAHHANGEAFGQAIGRFLSSNNFTAKVAGFLDRIEHNEWFEILSEAHNADLASQLSIACQRQLESKPTHPGLHVLIGLTALRGESINPLSIANRLHAGIDNLERLYGSTEAKTKAFAGEIVARIFQMRPDQFDKLITELIPGDSTNMISRAAYPYVTDQMLRRRCAVPWLNHIVSSSYALRSTSLEFSS